MTIALSEKQMEALDRLLSRHDSLPTFIQPFWFDPEVIAVHIENQTIGIEPDGYTHT